MSANCEQRVNSALEEHLHSAEPAPFPRIVEKRERRSELRLARSFPARVDVDHEAFGLDCVLDNISASGLYLRMPLQIKSFSEMSLVVQLRSGPTDRATAAIRGRVIRDEPQMCGKRGIAVMISDYCFL